jgi:hypothetical protein
MKALAKDYKMLWDKPSELPMVVIKTSTTPRIEQPCFSLMAWSTESGLQACAHGDFLTSGLGSRVVFWFMTRPERNFDEGKGMEVSTETREALAQIYRLGETLAGKTVGSDEDATKLLQNSMVDPKGGKISMPIHTAIASTISIENEAYFNRRYAVDWQYLQLLHNSANGKQKDLASIYSRKFQIAVRLAAIRSLSHKREHISDCDLDWGISLIDVLLTRSVGIFHENEVVTHSDEDAMRRTEKVFYTIAKLQKQVNEPITRRDLARNIRISSKNLDEAIIRLCETEKINVLDKNLRIVKPLKVERGLRFYIAED